MGFAGVARELEDAVFCQACAQFARRSGEQHLRRGLNTGSISRRNFPPDKQSCGYTELWNAFKRITAGASATEKTALYSGTAARVYKMIVP